MRKYKLVILIAAGFGWASLLNAQDARPASSPSSVRSEAGHSFHWPNGKKAAVSLTFDDARVSQIDVGLPLFEKMGVKVTFFVESDNVRKRLDGWKRAVADGDEIGNHTVTHPCSGRFPWSQKNALQNYDLKMMAEQLDGNTEQTEQVLGVKPVDFAYPCGEKFLGKDLNISYVPLVAERFLVGRIDGDQPNDPMTVDFAQAQGIPLDRLDFSQMKEIVDRAVSQGGWLITTDHNIGTPSAADPKELVIDSKALAELITYLKDPANGIWLGTVEEIGSYVKRTREAEK